MIVRVSNVEYFRQWRDDESEFATLDSLLARLRGQDVGGSHQMLAGTAFHEALEKAPFGKHESLSANGFTFHFDRDFELELPLVRELRASKTYGEIEVTGCVDIIEGRRVEDHKTTGKLDIERYLEGYQWRFYLDIFDADVFRWNIFEIREDRTDPNVYTVDAVHKLEQYRYPGLSRDCAKLANDLADLIADHIPEQLAEAA